MSVAGPQKSLLRRAGAKAPADPFRSNEPGNVTAGLRSHPGLQLGPVSADLTSRPPQLGR